MLLGALTASDGLIGQISGGKRQCCQETWRVNWRFGAPQAEGKPCPLGTMISAEEVRIHRRLPLAQGNARQSNHSLDFGVANVAPPVWLGNNRNTTLAGPGETWVCFVRLAGNYNRFNPTRVQPMSNARWQCIRSSGRHR